MQAWLVRYNRFDPINRWVIEDVRTGKLSAVLDIIFENVTGRTVLDDQKCIHSVEFQGYLSITDNRATISSNGKRK